jgi:hypothetical protein
MRALKSLLLFSLSSFFLALAWVIVDARLGASRSARADFNATGGVVGIVAAEYPHSYNGWVLLGDGRVLEFGNLGNGSDMGFRPDTFTVPAPPMPVPISDIKLWSYGSLVTNSDEVWVLSSWQGPGWTWVNLGTPPGLPVPGAASSMGDLKGRFSPKR